MIVMISGCCWTQDGFKTSKSPPFSLPVESERRLVSAGVAKFVEKTLVETEDSRELTEDSRELTEEILAKKTLAELKNLSENMKKTVNGKSKQDYINAILGPVEEELPDLSHDGVVL